MTEPNDDAILEPAVYGQLLADIKARIRTARVGAALAVNRALIELYWQIGHEILRMRSDEGWGSKISTRLAADLRREFPDMTGLSRTNLHYMRTLAQAWPEADGEIVQRVVEQLPWGHNITLLTKLDDRTARVWYAQKAIEHGWSRPVLEAQISTGLRERSGTAITSFDHALPPADSELVRDAIKDPYNFEFLKLADRSKERDLETALLRDVESFLMEMGRGFALVGRQWPLRIPNSEGGMESEFFIDLLFFNYLLNRFVVIDLKVEDFKPEFAGKMNFYLNAIDALERQPGQHETIGLILCPGRDRTVTEWALRGLRAPVAVARYVTADMALTAEAPAELQPALPDLPALASELTSTVDAARRRQDGE
ncbi:MAG: PDDEXK nuclease domain-containing protein [Solirubrobacteraceae bacterium]